MAISINKFSSSLTSCAVVAVACLSCSFEVSSTPSSTVNAKSSTLPVDLPLVEREIDALYFKDDIPVERNHVKSQFNRLLGVEQGAAHLAGLASRHKEIDFDPELNMVFYLVRDPHNAEINVNASRISIDPPERSSASRGYPDMFDLHSLVFEDGTLMVYFRASEDPQYQRMFEKKGIIAGKEYVLPHEIVDGAFANSVLLEDGSRRSHDFFLDLKPVDV